MQENRSFDHYFGVMRGVRGFGDPHPVTLPSGRPVWYQADGSTVVPPFRPDVGNLALTFIEDLDHSWDGTHQMFNGGNWDQWLPAKTTTCMAHMERSDLPFHYALADAFTVCDGYHCSMLGPTDPNRYYMWTGWDGNDGQGGGPVIANDELGYSWQTYPERLQAAGDQLEDLPGHRRRPGRRRCLGLYRRSLHRQLRRQLAAVLPQLPERRPPAARCTRRPAPGTDVDKSGGFFDILAADVASGQLPSVSWIVAPEAYTEHPAWPAGYGAWYTAGVLNALTSVPEVWSKTALLITFDENDGFFDHVVGPYPNVHGLAGHSTVPLDNELFDGRAGTPGGTRRGRRAVRSRRPRAVARRLAVEHRRLGLLGGVRPHVADPLHRGALRRRRAQHHSVAAGRLRRSDLGVRFRERVGPRAAAAAASPPTSRTRQDSAELPPGAAGGRIGPDPGAGRAAVAPARLPLRRRFDAKPATLNLAVRNHGQLGVGLQARSLTVAGAPYSLHGRRRRQAGRGATQPGDLRPQRPRPKRLLPPLRRLSGDGAAGRGGYRATSSAVSGSASRDGWRPPPRAGRRRGRRRVRPDHRIELHGTSEITIDTRHSGGWYDIALTHAERPQLQLPARGPTGVRQPVDQRSATRPQIGHRPAA